MVALQHSGTITDVPDSRDIDMVLVTGAGASCAFGDARMGGSPNLPLMREWSDLLVSALGTGGHQLRELVGLDQGLEGPEFEQRLGDFLALAAFFPSLDRIVAPSASLLRDARPTLAELQSWYSSTSQRITEALDVIYQSLIDNFGWERVNSSAAQVAYRNLLTALQVTDSDRLVYATTNYDLIGESSLDRIGRKPDSGVRREFAGPGVASREILDADNLVDVVGRYTPVLHLHGAIGWIDDPSLGPTVVHSKTHDRSRGVPIAMLPSLVKDYRRSPTIDAIWREFRKALRRAKRVFVLGHSLNDLTLLEALATNVTPYQRIAFVTESGREPPPVMRAAFQRLNGSRIFSVTFDAKFTVAQLDIRPWNLALRDADVDESTT